MQLAVRTRRVTVPGMSVDPLAQQEKEAERFSVDLPVADAKFLERYAAYRNALNAAQSRNVKKWNRKSAAEAFIAAQISLVAKEMAAVFSEHGELPYATDEKAVMAYAKAVLAAADKSSKKR